MDTGSCVSIFTPGTAFTIALTSVMDWFCDAVSFL
jgi:hypothetical protein